MTTVAEIYRVLQVENGQNISKAFNAIIGNIFDFVAKLPQSFFTPENLTRANLEKAWMEKTNHSSESFVHSEKFTTTTKAAKDAEKRQRRVPEDEKRCIATKHNGERCTRPKHENSDLCKTHGKKPNPDGAYEIESSPQHDLEGPLPNGTEIGVKFSTPAPKKRKSEEPSEDQQILKKIKQEPVSPKKPQIGNALAAKIGMKQKVQPVAAEPAEFVPEKVPTQQESSEFTRINHPDYGLVWINAKDEVFQQQGKTKQKIGIYNKKDNEIHEIVKTPGRDFESEDEEDFQEDDDQYA